MLSPPLTPARLREPHSSLPRNARICEALFLARYIEKYGTGTLMMIRQSVEHALPEPDFEQRGGEFAATVWRDWLTQKVIATLGLNDRQQQAIRHMQLQGRISNPDYRNLFAVSKPTASRDLEHLNRLGVLARVGTTGKSTYYVLGDKGLTKGSHALRPHGKTRQKPAKPAIDSYSRGSQSRTHDRHQVGPK